MKLTRNELYEQAHQFQQLSDEIAELRSRTNTLERKRDPIEHKLSRHLASHGGANQEILLGCQSDGFILRWKLRRGTVKYKEELVKRVTPDELYEIQASVPDVKKLDVLPRAKP